MSFYLSFYISMKLLLSKIMYKNCFNKEVLNITFSRTFTFYDKAKTIEYFKNLQLLKFNKKKYQCLKMFILYNFNTHTIFHELRRNASFVFTFSPEKQNKDESSKFRIPLPQTFGNYANQIMSK